MDKHPFYSDKTLKRMPASQLMPLYLESMRADGSVTIPVSGNSMCPFVCHLRDTVTLRPIEGKRIGLGDIVLYTRQQENGEPKYVMHRVVGKKGGAFTMCGDAQTEKEPGVTRSGMLAVASAVSRSGRTVRDGSAEWLFYKHVWRLLRPFRRRIFILYSKLRKPKAKR